MSAIVHADVLRAFVDNACAIVNESKIHLNDDGLRACAVDPASVAMLDETLAAGAFESYEFGGGVVGVSLERLAEIVGMADSDALVHLTLDDETRKLHIESGGLEFTVALIDTDSIRQEPDVPDVDEQLTARLVTDARALQRAESAADLCSDYIAFGASADGEVPFYATAEGDTDDVRLEWDEDETGEGSHVDADGESLFSLDYLGDILRPLDADGEVSLRIGDEVPLFLDGEFADGAGEVRFMLAPRIQSDGGRT